MAQLVARGSLAIGDELVNESVAGTVFTGRALEGARVGPFDAVVPEIAGRASITGVHQWWVEPDDEVGEGFFLS